MKEKEMLLVVVVYCTTDDVRRSLTGKCYYLDNVLHKFFPPLISTDFISPISQINWREKR